MHHTLERKQEKHKIPKSIEKLDGKYQRMQDSQHNHYNLWKKYGIRNGTLFSG